MILFFIPSIDRGAYGIKYGLLKEFILTKFVKKNMNTIYMPYIPKVVPPIMNSIRYHLILFINSGSVNRRADMAVMASTIIIIGDTIPALTAASPSIRAPTTEIAVPPIFGIRISLSLNISKERSIIRASKKAGKGTLLLCEAKFMSNSKGSIS